MKRVKHKKVNLNRKNRGIYTGSHQNEPVKMQLFVYDDSRFEEFADITLEKAKDEIEKASNKDVVVWLNVHGLSDAELIKQIGNIVVVDDYVVQDILNINSRPRIEDLENNIFFNIKSILEQTTDGIRVEQISFLLKGNLLVSFQERKSDFFTEIRERIRNKTGMVRRKKNDYLLYLLLDAVMENFFISLESYENTLDETLTIAKDSSNIEVLKEIEKSRDDLYFLKRSILPLREALYNLKNFAQDEVFEGLNKKNYNFFSRLHQKALELLEQIDYDMNSIESATNIFFSIQTQKMNMIMKTLTIVSVIFIPLTFVVGVYGMNFDNMPEIHAQNGYYVVMVVMSVIALLMIAYFKKKDWF